MLYIIIALLISFSLEIRSQEQICRFADLFTIDDLLYNRNNAIHHFKMNISLWEGKFGNGVGYNNVTGITYDGHKIDHETGNLHENLQFWTAASKEALHVNILTLYLLDDQYAKMFFNNAPIDHIIDILTKKINSYDDFHRRYPGFGGFLPWFAANGTNMNLLDAWRDKVPGLDNGQLIWSILSLIISLNNKNYTNLAKRYQDRIDLMINTSIPVFYDGNGGIRCVTKIRNMTDESQQFNKSNYFTDGDCYLDDPYEGELMAYFMDLYAPWIKYNYTIDEREKIWLKKQAKLKRVEYVNENENITVQQGYWFSSHEQWKYFYLPYMDIPIQRRLFMNGEKARTMHSNKNHIPGLYASVASTVPNDTYNVEYLSACGIQSIASEPVLHMTTITPYASFPVILADETIGLIWYLNMLHGSSMQNVYGSTEATNITGTAISPVITWDSKVTTVVAMLSKKLIDENRQLLIYNGLYERFYTITDREWKRVFGQTNLNGEHIPLSLPSVHLSKSNLNDFSQCRLTTNPYSTTLRPDTSTKAGSTSIMLCTLSECYLSMIIIILFIRQIGYL
ncbi:unnamed protein product [Didymodactylos carnosus]|uniref:Endo-beta-1,2-glucanase SGL domain-containing protein n=1 Tax=Didymodactylos carnosus TaxID=1234261 RepID=A0A813UJN9_9BILA|nr:unnamed protein product [Didymodactylos carnosus]CAF1087964.1 unnamed protein product [Didymodactylos carnosus]CAF3610283.1 unnamed protein product [Didymodactylos carnosus]CAF3849741.1 unnamed protein product [Didymodactylos carnosus]